MKWPNLKHLHYFVTLHQEQHFHRAAQRCNVSQSTLSTAIQNLEEHFGSQLLEREHKTFVFTSLGLDVVYRAKVILQEAGELVEYAQNPGNWKIGNRAALADKPEESALRGPRPPSRTKPSATKRVPKHRNPEEQGAE